VNAKKEACITGSKATPNAEKMNSSSRAFRIGAWVTAGALFVAWQMYDQKHPKEFSASEQDKWNERVKRETMLGTKPSAAGAVRTTNAQKQTEGSQHS